MTGVREVAGVRLAETVDDPLLRHWVDPRRVVRALVSDDGRAAVVEQPGGWTDAPATRPAVLAVGPPDALDPLLAEAAPLVAPAWRVVADATSAAALPHGLRPAVPRDWLWLLTTRAPASAATGPSGRAAPVEPLDLDRDTTALDALLDVEAPDTFARRGLHRSEWVGVRDPRDAERLLAVGALLRRPDGSGSLGGIAVRAEHRRRGLGEAVTTELTRLALGLGPGVAALGVYVDNPGAIALYRRLGYRVVHHFTAGLV